MKKILVRIRLGIGVLAMIFAMGCFGYVSEPVNSEPWANEVERHTGQASEATERVPGIIVHIDPQTGRIIAPPSGQVPPSLGTIKQPLPPLQQQLSPVPGGGVMIELDDRFRTPLTATIDTDGKVRFEHKSAGHGTNDKE